MSTAVNPYVMAGGQVASQATGGLFSFIGARKRRQHDRQLAEAAQQHNIDMWHMQNKYNSPAEQMKRLKDAGLNPNLIYGQSAGGASGQATSKPEAVVPRLSEHQSSALGMHMPDLIDTFTKLYKLRQEEVKAKWADRLTSGKDSLLTHQIGLAGEKQLGENMDNAIKRAAFDDLVANYKWRAEHARTRAEREKYLKMITKAEAEISTDLKKWNMTAQDHILGRILLLIGKQVGMDPSDLPGQVTPKTFMPIGF